MAIKDGSVADADEVMNAFGKVFKNQAQVIFNADLIGYDSDLDVEYENLKKDTLYTSDNIDPTSEILNVIPMSANILDEFADESIDANIWTVVGTVTEPAKYLKVYSSSSGGTDADYATGDGINAPNFNTQSSIFLYYNYHASGNGASSCSWCAIRIVDESGNYANLRVKGNGGGGGETATIGPAYEKLRININPSTDSAGVSTDYSVETDTGVDLSSLVDGDEWHIELRTFVNCSNWGNASLKVYFVRYLLNTPASADFISTATASSDTITNAILVANKDANTGTSATYYLSANNGSNWEEATLNEIHRFTNTGTQLKMKVEMTSAAEQVYVLNHYAVMYNLY